MAADGRAAAVYRENVLMNDSTVPRGCRARRADSQPSARTAGHRTFTDCSPATSARSSAATCRRRVTPGVSVAVHEDTGWGAELDFGHTAAALAGREILDVTSYMVNALWLRPTDRSARSPSAALARCR